VSDPVEIAPFTADGQPPRALRKRVAALLAAGELVALPTETVYGLFARADRREALDRLRNVKRRPEERVFTWHVGDAAALERFPGVWNAARRLAAKYWPGPLTLVLHGVPEGLELASSGGWTGVRLPAFAPTARLLAGLEFPVVGSSANRHGAASLITPLEIAREFAGEVALVLDGGAPPLREGSVVLKLGPGAFELLRPGIIDLAQLRKAAGLAIGFVCTGNTCRSPMAQALAADVLARALEVAAPRSAEFGYSFRSMGVLAQEGSPASRHAIEILARAGLDLSGHRSTALDNEVVAGLDRVYALTRGHLEALRAGLSAAEAKRCELLDPEGRDVPDPIGGTLDDYARCAASIRRALEQRVVEWV
jgi:tRNA threonylcarbamoyl adenosine modification protein (Sua5/YciO/YrdC/YwlC family)